MKCCDKNIAKRMKTKCPGIAISNWVPEASKGNCANNLQNEENLDNDRSRDTSLFK